MAVKIRLTRRGRKKLAIYNVVVADARAPRDGKYIENLGIYNPNTNPATVDIDEDKTLDWVMKGAQPTDTARRILSYRGIMLRKHLQLGVQKGAITQEDADKKFADWKAEKEGKIQGKVDSLAKQKALDVKKKLDDEKKKNEARVADQKAKLEAATTETVEESAETEEEVSTEAVTEEAPAVEAPVVEEAPVAEEPAAAAEVAEEAPAEEPQAEVEEVPAVEEKIEEPKAEVKEEAPAAEEKAEEAPEAEAKDESAEEEKK